MLTLVKVHSGYYYSQQHEFNTEYSQTLDFALKYKHEYGSFLSSPLAVKRDVAVTFLLSCMCVHCARVRASGPDLSGS